MISNTNPTSDRVVVLFEVIKIVTTRYIYMVLEANNLEKDL